jgi:hypothetical protein
MDKQTDLLNEIFDTGELKKAGYPELIFNADHLEGMAEIVRMNNDEDKLRALKNLVGMTSQRNFELGMRGFSTKRKNIMTDITDKIQKGIDIKDDVAELNKITKTAYPEFKGDLYRYNPATKSIIPTENFRMDYTPENAFRQYFNDLIKSPVGLKELQTQYKNPKDPRLKDIILEDPVLRQNVVIKDLETIPGVTTASQIDRPQSALEREAFERFNKKFASQRGSLNVGAFADAAKDAARLYGPAAGKIAQTTLRGAGSYMPFETLFMGDMQQRGLSPKEMALDIGTLGLGTIFKDIKEKFDYVKSKGLGDELQSAFRKQTINQQARPALGGVEGMFQEQTLTPNEEAALRAYNLDAQNIIDMRRSYQADEYRKTDEAFGLDDPILRTGAMGGGIMRLNFSVGGLASLFRKAAQVSDALRKVKNSTFSMFNNVRMFGNQKGIEKNLEGYTNIPEKNPKISALEDIQKLKATVPEKYHQDLDIMMRSVQQNNFETAWKEYQKFEKDLDPSLKFENIPEEYFPMIDPLNDSFVITGPRDSFKRGRYQIKTSMQLDETGKPTGKYQTEKYDTFDPETRTFRDEPVLVGASTEKGKKGLN